MKKIFIKFFIASIFALAGSIVSIKASEKPKNYQNIINNFIDSYKTNDYKTMKSLFSSGASFKFNRGSKIVVCSCEDLLNLVKQNEGVVFQGFTANSQIISQNDAMIMVKIILYQKEANQIEQYITLENNDKTGWEITQVCNIYL